MMVAMQNRKDSLSTAEIRPEYSGAPLHAHDLDADPIVQFCRWFDEAKAAGILHPEAMTLCTAAKNSQPSARTVLLKEVSPRGFTFFTSYESRKGKDLRENPYASAVFFWAALERQVIVAGAVERLTREESEVYFKTRPRGAQIGTWASDQSAVLTDAGSLERKISDLEKRFANTDVPLPPHWGGFRLLPSSIEFWQGRPNRIHDRLRYGRDGETWVIERLAP
jgi:pyridoxamine 5'-phosphate oxidase